MSDAAPGAGGQARRQLGAERAAGEDEELGAAARREGGQGGGHQVRTVRRRADQADRRVGASASSRSRALSSA